MFEEADLTVAGNPRRHFRQAIEPVRDRAGEVIGLIGAATDITEQKETQRQLREALTFRERLMGILGHELRNPLNTIIMADRPLPKQEDLTPEGRDQVLRSLRAAERMREMIDTLLDFSRVRLLGQKVPETPMPADLGEIAGGVADELRLGWPDHGIDIDVGGDPHGEWDPGRLSQIISNLIRNGITYGDPHTPVRVLIDGTGEDVILKVSNHGPPIPQDVIPVLFEPFRRGVDEELSPGGLGLGLYIVQLTVQAHGGTVGVESSAELGTTFTVRLPCHPISPAAPTPASSTVH